MRKLLIIPLAMIAALVLGLTVALAAAGGTPAAEADFGQCVAMMAQTGPHQHAAMMGMDNFGQVVQHCQMMHTPPRAR